MTPHDFYNAVYSTAIGLGANDVQARLAAAQASEETGFGKSMVGNNLFGIKAGTTYAGPSVSANTQEEYNGNTVTERANFRAYDDFTGSVRDYLGFIQSNFPDAWSAPTFSDAVQGLNSGVYGKYATRAAYGQHVKAIDNKYGALQYAQEPQNVPTPYGPSDQIDLAGVPDDVIPVADQNFVNADPQFAFAQDPANVPTPYSANSLGGGLLTAFQQNPEYQTPFDAVLSPSTPAVNQWADMAAAKPVQAPMDSVTASGLLGATPALTADAKANPMMSLAAEGLLGTNPGLSANATVSGLPEVASVSSRMGIADPGFDNSRFDGNTVSVATDFDPGRFASPSTTAFDASRFGPPSIDVATNTQSFMDQPAAPANLGSFADAYAAQRGPTSGIYSADMSARMADVQRQLQDPARLAPAVQQPSYDVTATGLLAGNAPLSAQATVPSLQTDNTITGSVTPSLLSPSSLVSANPSLSTNIPGGILGAQPIQQNAFVDSFPSSVANNTFEPATINGVVAPPTLDTMQVAEQPSIATVEGPATTPALEQQQEQATTTAARTTPQTTTQTTTETAAKPSLSSRLSKAFNPGTIGGGLLGGLAAGPVGGILGGLLGNSVYNGGLLSQPSYSINPIGSGVQAAYSVWGGGQPVGSQAIATDGQRITSLPGGLTAVTNQYGVTTAFDSTGKGYAVFGGLFSGDDQDQEAAAY